MSGYLENLLSSNEEILFLTRRHPLAVLPRLVLAGAGAALLAVLAGILLPFFPQHQTPVLVLLGSGMAVLILWGGWGFLSWWNEVYVITNRRVLQVQGVLNKEVLDSSLDKVNDVVLRQSLAGRLMGYGDVEILTASEAGINRLEKMARPVAFKRAMLEAKDAYERWQEGGSPVLGPAEGLDPLEETEQLLQQLTALYRAGLLTEAEYEEKRRRLVQRLVQGRGTPPPPLEGAR